jgi:hypothetical protein
VRQFTLARRLKIANTSLLFSFPILLNSILKFTEDTQGGDIDYHGPWYDTYKGYWLSALLASTIAAKALIESYYFHIVYRSGIKQEQLSVLLCITKSFELQVQKDTKVDMER